MTVENRGLWRAISYAIPLSLLCWAPIIAVVLEITRWN